MVELAIFSFKVILQLGFSSEAKMTRFAKVGFEFGQALVVSHPNPASVIFFHMLIKLFN